MAIKLKDELEAAGYEGSPADFRRLVRDTFSHFHTKWTDEELLFHPTSAMLFCGAIMQQAGVAVPEHIILRTLVNTRKH
jgi:hypothetical protein